jgi:hypothetical protein
MSFMPKPEQEHSGGRISYTSFCLRFTCVIVAIFLKMIMQHIAYFVNHIHVRK